MMDRIVAVLAAFLSAGLLQPAQPVDAYLTWSAAKATEIGEAAYKRGRVGGLLDLRGLRTERSYNYKLAATWFTPEVIRATARLAQLRSRLSATETRALVAEAESSGPTVVLVEIDPREGSGVIPDSWEAFLKASGRTEIVHGTVKPELRHVRALAGVLRRNYDYDRFWVSFPLTLDDGTPLFRAGDQNAELIVRIYDKEGHVEWPIPESIRHIALKATSR